MSREATGRRQGSTLHLHVQNRVWFLNPKLTLTGPHYWDTAGGELSKVTSDALGSPFVFYTKQAIRLLSS